MRKSGCRFRNNEQEERAEKEVDKGVDSEIGYNMNSADEEADLVYVLIN